MIDTARLRRTLIAAAEQRGMSPQIVAYRTGITYAHMRALESGETDPDLTTLAAWARAVGLTATVVLRSST